MAYYWTEAETIEIDASWSPFQYYQVFVFVDHMSLSVWLLLLSRYNNLDEDVMY